MLHVSSCGRNVPNLRATEPAMALLSSAAMAIFNDFNGDAADHDDWHSYEHIHERLSVPGFLRASRWVATGSGQRYLILYEVAGIDVASSEGYLNRLNDPTPWTTETMHHIRGMTRGICHIAASAGFGLGSAAAILRFEPVEGEQQRLADRIARDILPAIASRRGMVGAHLLRPAPPPPMTREQSLRGSDNAMPWLVIATGYDTAARDRAAAEHLDPSAFRRDGASAEITLTKYALHYTATAEEVARTPKPTELTLETRRREGPRN
jgi:hypothetical protein